MSMFFLMPQLGLQIQVYNGKYFSYISTKTYVVGTQKHRLDETFLLNMLKLVGKKILTSLGFFFCLSWTI